jgi:uncharacterized protein (DUF433 family)
MYLEKMVDSVAETNLNRSVICDLELRGGEPTFVGTRIKVQTLFDHIEENQTLDTFFKDISHVKKEQVKDVLEFCKKAIKDRLVL